MFLARFQRISAFFSAFLCNVFAAKFLKNQLISAYFLHNFSRPGLVEELVTTTIHDSQSKGESCELLFQKGSRPNEICDRPRDSDYVTWYTLRVTNVFCGIRSTVLLQKVNCVSKSQIFKNDILCVGSNSLFKLLLTIQVTNELDFNRNGYSKRTKYIRSKTTLAIPAVVTTFNKL